MSDFVSMPGREAFTREPLGLKGETRRAFYYENEWCHELLSYLKDQEADVYVRYYRDVQHLDDIGKVYGVSGTRVRQLLHKAIRKLVYAKRHFEKLVSHQI